MLKTPKERMDDNSGGDGGGGGGGRGGSIGLTTTIWKILFNLHKILLYIPVLLVISVHTCDFGDFCTYLCF